MEVNRIMEVEEVMGVSNGSKRGKEVMEVTL